MTSCFSRLDVHSSVKLSSCQYITVTVQDRWDKFLVDVDKRLETKSMEIKHGEGWTKGDFGPGEVSLVNAEDGSVAYLKDFLYNSSRQWLIVVFLRHFA
jgi:hypothetical protein